MKNLEEPTIERENKIDVLPLETDRETLDAGGTEFETKLRAAEQKAASKETAAKDEPSPAKKDDAPAKKDEPAKAKTPMEVAPAAKKDEPPAIEEELKTLIASEPPANASANSKANHAAMRKGLERANSTIAELRTKLEAASKAPAAPAELEERIKLAEQAVKDREAELERVAFERSPRFQKFVKEGDAELASAKSYVEGLKTEDGAEINPNVIDLAARTAGAKRVAILTDSGMDASTIAAVTSHLARADAINRDREAAIENWKENNVQYTAEQTRAAEAKATQVKANEDKVFAEVGKKMAETLAPFQKVEGNDDWNTGVDQRLKEAQEFFDGKKPLHETAQLIHEGIAGRVYKDAFEDLRTKYNDLVAENERTKASRPGAAATSQETTTVNVKGDPMALAGDTFEQNRAKHQG